MNTFNLEAFELLLQLVDDSELLDLELAMLGTEVGPTIEAHAARFSTRTRMVNGKIENDTRVPVRVREMRASAAWHQQYWTTNLNQVVTRLWAKYL